MTNSEPDPLLREAISEVRHNIRVSLDQIISYAEIISEDTSSSDPIELSKYLRAIIAECELALRITVSLADDVEDLERLAATAREGLTDKCNRMMAAFDEMRPFTESWHLSRSIADVAKLHEAAEAFQRAVDSLAPHALLSARSQAVSERFGTSRLAGEHKDMGAPLERRSIILIVDDNMENLDLLSRRLLRDGYEVMLAEGGRQALRMVRRYSFDLILLDIMMPGVDGFAVLSQLKNDPESKTIPVIMISALDEIEHVISCIEQGAEDYLAKPFNRTLLRARIRSSLQRKHLRDEERRQREELQRALAIIDKQRLRTEELLLNILPASVATELQANGHVRPTYFEDVSIVFADFVGFSRATEDLSAEELVSALHSHFTQFDRIMARYGLEKLKTIGDCYMFAGGLPSPTRSHPIDSVLASLEMIQAVEDLGQDGTANWELRVGVHVGPVVGGIVGIHKFAFDVWGEAVNFGSRMESGGLPGKVNLSSNAYSRVKDFFSCETRGRIRTKDEREVEMYFVNGVASGLRRGGGSQLRDSFERRYEAYFGKRLMAFPERLMSISSRPILLQHRSGA